MIFMYLDDWLVVGRSRGETEAALQLTWHLASDLGFLINTKKSHPVPSQVPTFLGAFLNLRRGLARPSEDRLLNLRQCVSLFLPTVVAPARAWLRLLGLMASLVDLVDFCRLRMRPIQLHLLSFYRPRWHPIDHPVPTTSLLVPHLRWWLVEANITQGRVFRPPRPSVLITTDASGYGWGATLHPRQVAGVWGPAHQSSHINVLEMLAVTYALKHFQSDVRGQAVLVRCDNATVVPYINHQDGTRSGHLCALIDRPHVDLFASRMNNQLPIYCARGPDPNAWQTDALSVRWDGLLAYAFPPISLVSRVLTKIEQEDAEFSS
ncbi:uncharacterized protein LOC119741020 [Patiria miniata]|uniref:Reverse transcriptase domain-containing protein n=1 Tax=Patiria miniata TaxID=46514 RepID=A0A914B942_PATMI|nr:uncharacterized protein LOC119741020 [Patiria miniata]